MAHANEEKRLSAKKLNDRALALDVVEMRKTGASISIIAQRTGITEMQVRRIIERELKRITTKLSESTAEMRQLDCERLDRMLMSVYPMALGRPERKDALGRVTQQAKDPNLKAVASTLRIMRRKAQLLGLDLPSAKQDDGKVLVRRYMGVDVDGV